MHPVPTGTPFEIVYDPDLALRSSAWPPGSALFTAPDSRPMMPDELTGIGRDTIIPFLNYVAGLGPQVDYHFHPQRMKASPCFSVALAAYRLSKMLEHWGGDT